MRRVVVVASATAGALALAVAAFVLLTREPAPAPARLAHYAISADGRELTVTVALGSLETITSRHIEEDRDVVKVVVLSRQANGTGTLNIVLVDLVFPLAAPLGERQVVDANGRLIPVAR